MYTAPYLYRDEGSLLRDFWDLARKAGFKHKIKESENRS